MHNVINIHTQAETNTQTQTSQPMHGDVNVLSVQRSFDLASLTHNDFKHCKCSAVRHA